MGWQDAPLANTALSKSGWQAAPIVGQQAQQSGPDWLRSTVQNDPNTTYGNILPIKHNEQTGEYKLALPESLRGLVRGTADLMDVQKGNYATPSSDEIVAGSLEQPFTPDALGTIMTVATLKPDAPTNLRKPEAKALLKNLKAGDVTPQQFAENLLKSSADDFAGELGGEPLKMQTQTSAKIAGDGMQTAREAMRDRLSNANPRVKAILEDTFGSQYNIDDALGTISQLKASEGDLYKAANGSIPRSELSSVLKTPAGAKAVGQATTNIENRLGTPQLVEDMIPIDQAHALAKALGEQVNRNPLTGAILEPSTAAPVEALRGNVIDTLRKASPEFDLAQTAAGEARGFEDAFSRGRQLAKMVAGEKTDDVLQRIALNEQQKPYSVAGMHQGLQDTISQVPLQTGNPAARIANQSLIEKTSELLGSEKAQQLADALMKEKGRIELAQRGLSGSNTPETMGVLADKVPLSKAGIVSKGIGAISDLFSQGHNKRLAEALFTASPSEKAVLAKEVMMYAPKSMQEKIAEFLANGSPTIRKLSVPSAVVNYGENR